MDRTPGERRLAAGTGVTANGAPELVSTSRRLDDVVDSLAGVAAADVRWAAPDGLELVGFGAAATVDAVGPERFERVRRSAASVFDSIDHDGPPAARPRAFGGFSFHDGPEPGPPWTGFASASFVVPRLTLARTPGGDTWLTAVESDRETATDALEAWRDRLADPRGDRGRRSPPGVASTRGSTSREEWTAQVEAAIERIAEGALTKVVLAQALTVALEDPIDVPATLDRLGREYPNCYRFCVRSDVGGTFFGAPPERLVWKRGRRLETEALAGSVPRGETPGADDDHAERLHADGKLGHEHQLVVEAIRTQLEPLASDVTVAERTVRRLANIQHLRTPIAATLDAGRHVLDLVEALHPTPAVGGVPPDVAWETIRDTEPFDRGWYAAPVGWFDGEGDGEFAVGIRSGVAADETVTLFAGNGIVADSDPDEEWDEVQLKFRPILDELR